MTVQDFLDSLSPAQFAGKVCAVCGKKRANMRASLFTVCGRTIRICRKCDVLVSNLGTVIRAPADPEGMQLGAPRCMTRVTSGSFTLPYSGSFTLPDARS